MSRLQQTFSGLKLEYLRGVSPHFQLQHAFSMVVAEKAKQPYTFLAVLASNLYVISLLHSTLVDHPLFFSHYTAEHSWRAGTRMGTLRMSFPLESDQWNCCRKYFHEFCLTTYARRSSSGYVEKWVISEHCHKGKYT
jgi:hypothetical protein